MVVGVRPLHKTPRMDQAAQDAELIRALNEIFIQACREGSWAMLSQVCSPDFRYVDGVTRELWDPEAYIEDLEENPAPSLAIDQVTIHVAGDTAGVSARTSHASGARSRYLDVYSRTDDGWLCVQATVWPLDPDPDPGGYSTAITAAAGTHSAEDGTA